MAARSNMVVERDYDGEELDDILVHWLDDLGALIDLSTGYTFTHTLRASPESNATVVATVTASVTSTGAAGSLVTDPATPNLTLSLADGIWAAYPALEQGETYWWRVAADRTSGGKDRHFYFKLRLT